ncbi:hypothetical protein O0L34_g3441 [Tuta absoluta]|nr:hypothetical protein O0L34_g3441 [Tuta absoluta]
MAKPSKSLQLMAQKLSLQEEDKVISKAAEFERLLQMKSTTNNITDIAKVVICLDLAATNFRVDFDQKIAIKCSGLKGPSYMNSRKIIENILELNSDQLTISSLCLTLQCNVQDLAQSILDEYKKCSKMELDLSMPQYVCMAVYQACRISKIKVSKSKLVDKSQLKPGQWTKLDADWTKFVDEKFAAVVKKKKGRPSKKLVTDDENKMEVDAEIIMDKKEEPTEPEIEAYDDWKRRILEKAYKDLEKINKHNQIKHKNSPSKHKDTKDTPSKQNTRSKHKESPNKHKETPNKHKDTLNKHKDTPNEHKDTPNKHKDSPNKHKGELKNRVYKDHNVLEQNEEIEIVDTDSRRNDLTTLSLAISKFNKEDVANTRPLQADLDVLNRDTQLDSSDTFNGKDLDRDTQLDSSDTFNGKDLDRDTQLDSSDTFNGKDLNKEDVEHRRPRQADPDGNETDSEIEFDNPSRPSLAYPSSPAFLFIFTTLLVGVIVRCLMLWTFHCIPYRVIMFALGGIAGFCANKYPSFRALVQVCYVEVDVLLITFLPIVVFNTSYSVDSHSFWKSFPQIVLVAVPGVLLTSLMVAFMGFYLIESSWRFSTAILFGIVCAPIYPMEVVRKLKEMSRGKYVSVLLLGEGLLGDATCMIAFTACYGVSSMALSTSSQICVMLLRYAGGGILLGILNGKIIGLILTLTYYDFLCAVSVTLAGSYLTYYIGEKYFYVSGLLATVIAGVIISNKKSTIAGDVDAVVTNFWAILTHAANTVLFTMVGVVIFEKVSYVITARQVALVFVTYATVYCSRLVIYFMMMPLLKRVGYGLSWQHGLACVWGGLRGPLSLCFALTVMRTPPIGEREAGEIFIVQTAGLVLLSLLINATTMQKVLKLLGLAEISLAKKANMTNCVKRVMMTRDRCISMLKMDKFLADANWDLVQEGTTIKHPYQLQMSGRGAEDDDLEDDTYMGYRYTTCPDCEREIPNEPTKKELAEMMREANQRVLKALKISYWRQYEHGKISKDGVRLLVQAVEVAADSDEGKVNLDMLGSLWRPKKHAIWLRRKLVKMMVPDTTQTQMPQNSIRMCCYRLVQNFWFDMFIYLVILANTPVILSEVILKPPIAPWVMYTIKSLNLMFYIIYIMEMIIKMTAFGVCGYFKSHWNKLDFVIIVFATGDLVLDVIDATTAWDKWSNLNSSVITATKLLRMLRFLRLCKLARVSVPKIMASIDRMIDIQLAFGYDVGKGFVTGEQEVCTLLPQLVDNKQIQDTLTAKLEADRLAVTRQLGMLQRDRPWTAITVKTRQATTSTLNIMLLDANQLKEEGFLDEMEYRLLVNSIQEKVLQCRHKGSLVAPSSPETQLRSVSWLQGNERVADFFLENSEILNFNYNDILISRGDEPKGIYILVSGLLEATYFPPESDIDEAIPNYEFLTDLKFDEPSQEYIVSGNAIGVLGALTSRPYAYTVRCDSAVQAYYITMPIVKEAFNLAAHPVLGLEASMWREIGIKLSLMVLPSVPAYHGLSTEKLNMRLEHAFVPCLKAFKVFVVNELMEDIILIDGVCQDLATREVFQPPCYIPRTAHRLIFPKSSQLMVSSSCPETKLLIVPAKDTDELDIMEDEVDDMQCELISNVSSRCLYHRIARKLSSDSRRTLAPRAGGMGRGGKRRRAPQARRVNYRESVWGDKGSRSQSQMRKNNTSVLTLSNMSEKDLGSQYFKPNSQLEISDPFFPVQSDPFFSVSSDSFLPVKSDPFFPVSSDPFFPVSSDPFFPVSSDPFFPVSSDPFLPDKSDPFFPVSSDPFFSVSSDPFFPVSSNPFFPVQSVPFFPVSSDPFLPVKSDPFFPVSSDPFLSVKSVPFFPVKSDPFYPVKSDQFFPVKSDPFVPVKSDPFFPVKSDPFFPVKSDPFFPVKSDPFRSFQLSPIRFSQLSPIRSFQLSPIRSYQLSPIRSS